MPRRALGIPVSAIFFFPFLNVSICNLEKNVVNSMLIRFTDEIKSRRVGNTPVNKEKCYKGFLRLKIWTGSNRMGMKADRCNPSAWEGEKKNKTTSYKSKQQEGNIQKAVMPERPRESGQQIRHVCNMPWKLM